MNMYQFDIIGLIHFISAISAMIFGMVVIFNKKGTKLHIRFGYGYSISMLILLVTAFMIYKVMGTFGPFHIAAVISSLTLLGGIIPAYIKKPEKTWLEFHYEFMNWSIIGLYAAFWSETFTRFFRFSGFWVLVATATALTVAIGAFLLKKRKKEMLAKYSKPS